MSLLGSTAMLFHLQMSSDIYMQPYEVISGGGHIGALVHRLVFISFPDYFLSLVCVQSGVVLAPHQLAPGQVEPVNWLFDNGFATTRLGVFEGVLWPYPFLQIIANPFPTPTAGTFLNGFWVVGRVLRWHYHVTITVTNPDSYLYYQAHRRRIGHIPLQALQVRPNGNDRQFMRLIFTTQLQQTRRSGN
ncbi:hypothetical protein D9619_011674 [Psilocybe cf. subviscida]|uniref:Uncharacterized protein n=1 Tax=Psilocybe cf. subviscida TaxID=2480587 RepID=A0A8H5BUA7_9AGAR|nr:hypothetical protein D9619_011674 [Psilocybe cf. subviscida]